MAEDDAVTKDEKAEATLPRTERAEAPAYLNRYLQRRHDEALDSDRSDTTPLYLRQFRQRRADPGRADSPPPTWEGRDLPYAQTLSEDNRNKEISAPPSANKKVANDVYLIRHGETQGYSSESGLTPLGSWQAHTYGRTLAKRVRDGETVVLRHAATNRAGDTAGQIHRGFLDGLGMFDKDLKVHEPQPMDEFRNFRVATPSGFRDVTAAFREYYSTLEEFERTKLGDRPMWLVDVDRFWRVQQGGGDPITHWLQIPMLHFEPPVMCVRRFWLGIQRLAAEFPDSRLVIPTHSGPIRAFAIAAFGYDPGEPYNLEHVRVKLFEGRSEALVSYRNRVQEIQIPAVDHLPSWSPYEEWTPTE